MRTARKLHLYTGVFFAPAIVFFALSGFFQSFGWHEEHDGKPPMAWVATISEIHKDQRLPAPPRPQNPAPSTSTSPASSGASATAPQPSTSASPASASGAGAGAPSSTPPTQVSQPPSPNAQATPGKAAAPPRRPRKKSFPLQIFMGLLAISLIGSTLVGVWMAFQIQRNTALILGLLVAGIVIPLAALFIGIQ